MITNKAALIGLDEANSMLGIIGSGSRNKVRDLLNACEIMDMLDEIKEQLPPSHMARWEALWNKAWRIAHASKRRG